MQIKKNLQSTTKKKLPTLANKQQIRAKEKDGRYLHVQEKLTENNRLQKWDMLNDLQSNFGGI